MTELLQKAIAAISELSDEQQNEIASRLLAELEDEQRWQAQFESTTDGQLEALVAMAEKDIADGGVVPFDEALPVQ